MDTKPKKLPKGCSDYRGKDGRTLQPIHVVGEVIRFKKNAIVEFLLREGGFDMNSLGSMGFSKADQEQFAQLIGYSVSGFGELSYCSKAAVRAADAVADSLPI